jgi:hypothetical protein
VYKVGDLGIWFSVVFGHWQHWLSGGGFGGAAVIVVGVLGYLEIWKMPKKWYAIIFLGCFFLGANYMAWDEAYRSMKAREGDLQRANGGLQKLAVSVHEKAKPSAKSDSYRQPPSWQQPASGHGGPIGPTMALQIVQEFKSLPQPCAVRVTTSADKEPFRSTLIWLLTQQNLGAGCSLWDERSTPNIDDPAGPKKATAPGVVIHWDLAFKDGERIAHFFDADGMKISISHQMSGHAPPNLIWIDVGPGSPWK